MEDKQYELLASIADSLKEISNVLKSMREDRVNFRKEMQAKKRAFLRSWMESYFCKDEKENCKENCDCHKK